MQCDRTDLILSSSRQSFCIKANQLPILTTPISRPAALCKKRRPPRQGPGTAEREGEARTERERKILCKTSTVLGSLCTSRGCLGHPHVPAPRRCVILTARFNARSQRQIEHRPHAVSTIQRQDWHHHPRLSERAFVSPLLHCAVPQLQYFSQ